MIGGTGDLELVTAMVTEGTTMAVIAVVMEAVSLQADGGPSEAHAVEWAPPQQYRWATELDHSEPQKCRRVLHQILLGRVHGKKFPGGRG